MAADEFEIAEYPSPPHGDMRYNDDEAATLQAVAAQLLQSSSSPRTKSLESPRSPRVRFARFKFRTSEMEGGSSSPQHKAKFPAANSFALMEHPQIDLGAS